MIPATFNLEEYRVVSIYSPPAEGKLQLPACHGFTTADKLCYNNVAQISVMTLVSTRW